QDCTEAPPEVPKSAGADLRDPAAAAGLGFDPAPDQRRAAVRGAAMAALDAGPQPFLRGRVRPDPALRRPVAREAVAAWAGVGVLPPLLRRHSLPVPRPGQGRG